MKLLNLLKRPSTLPSAMPVVPPAPVSYQGYIDVLSEGYLAGWIRNLDDPTERVAYEVSLSHTNEILARGRADAYVAGLRKIGVGDGEHGYCLRLSRRLSQEEQDHLIVRPVPGGSILERSGFLATRYRPIQHIIMDLVDNCNLRCPFCVYDYAKTHTTHVMTEATIDAAVRFAPYVQDGGFWFSCLHEPTLHPRLVDYIRKVPAAYRSTMFYTSNLAKRMPASYFEALADSGMHHINISIESLEPAVYEKMRKGARFPIFKENWDRLVEAFGQGTAPPKLRYISLAYKSTFRQLPELTDYLLRERRASTVEVRHTYDVPHIPRDFRQAEYLGRDEWLWLRDQLAHYPADLVQVVLPPGLENPNFDHDAAAWSEHVAAMYEASGPAPPAIDAPPPTPFRSALPKGYLAGQCGLRLFWNGRLEVNAIWGDEDEVTPGELRLATINVRDIDDVEAFLDGLPI